METFRADNQALFFWLPLNAISLLNTLRLDSGTFSSPYFPVGLKAIG